MRKNNYQEETCQINSHTRRKSSAIFIMHIISYYWTKNMHFSEFQMKVEVVKNTRLPKKWKINLY